MTSATAKLPRLQSVLPKPSSRPPEYAASAIAMERYMQRLEDAARKYLRGLADSTLRREERRARKEWYRFPVQLYFTLHFPDPRERSNRLLISAYAYESLACAEMKRRGLRTSRRTYPQAPAPASAAREWQDFDEDYDDE